MLSSHKPQSEETMSFLFIHSKNVQAVSTRALLLGALCCPGFAAMAAPLTPGNLLVTSRNTLFEYTLSGQLV
jgi:hypothetical protein